MDCLPHIDDFSTKYKEGTPQIVWTTMIADMETAVSVYVKLAYGQPYSFLLESVRQSRSQGLQSYEDQNSEVDMKRARYSIIGMQPDLVWKTDENRSCINRNPIEAPDQFEEMDGAPLDAFREILEESEIDIPESLPPMAAGLMGYMGYDTIRHIEKISIQNEKVIDTPDGIYSRPTLVAVYDNIDDIIYLATPVRPTADLSAAEQYEKAHERLARAKDSLLKTDNITKMEETPSETLPIAQTSNMSAEDFKGMVKQAKDYILAGDIFQVVLSQRFETEFNLPPFALYRSLRRINPSPFLVFLNFPDFAIAGSSPELLVRLQMNEVTIRPIAGTRKRGKTAEEDIALEKDLFADPKERAEHLMLLDLGRNDVGRVSKIGTVKVVEDALITEKAEFYSHVMHIVSEVRGQLDTDNFDGLSALYAGFPAGTVSGAPKIRAMEIIEELESQRRGVYAGCVGYFGASGTIETCISLRTAIIKDEKIYIQAGAGIVADSDPDSEHQECVNKARAVVRAAEEAVRYAKEKQN